jgi:4-oxalocrotonate tautomerase
LSTIDPTNASAYDARVPIVRVEMYEGRSVEQKRRLARELTDTLARVIECDPASVRVLIDDYRPEDWAIGGTLHLDD